VPAYCDVALPVPLDRTFTYAVNPAQVPAVGARVIVPFSGQKLMGVVMRLHDEPLPEGVEAKPVQTVRCSRPSRWSWQSGLRRTTAPRWVR
jgi:primosomal protein N' (replication factor Y)